MKHYRVTFRDTVLRTLTQDIEAESLEELESKRKEGGPLVLAIEELSQKTCQVTLKEFGAFLDRLQTLCSSQVPLTVTLNTITMELPTCSFRLCLECITTDLECGKSFSYAISRHSIPFAASLSESIRTLDSRKNFANRIGSVVELFRRLHPDATD